ncbi:MAG: hypothetical protein LGR52_05185, partial [Candidatus Thiosymbion ectosymbiont of Robbea hypermnestra]|nr:hypothetical protein [Candidatus Thiosymbion ectosymbiont of Robbea hypermnestra]
MNAINANVTNEASPQTDECSTRAASQNSNRTGFTGLHRIDRIFVVAECSTPAHALTKPASALHNKKILFILNILLILY